MAEVPSLSTGVMELIMSGEDQDYVEKPILQILGAKKISGVEGSERYRLLVSDGKYLNSFTMLSTQLNDQYAAGDFAEFTVVRVDRYIISAANKSDKGNKRVLIFLELTVLYPGSEVGKKIGNPVPYSPVPSSSITTATNFGNTVMTTNIQTSSNMRENVTKPAMNKSNTSNYPSTNSNVGHQDLSHTLTNPICSLSPYQNKWIIKARVVSKSPIRTWSNAKGEGKLFSLDIMDDSGEIRCTAFRDLCDKFYEVIEVDKVYFISKCQLKPANKQYSSLKNDYELTFTNETVVQLCHEDIGVPEIKYNFVPISQIANIEPKSVIDIIGVCREVSDLQIFISKTTNRELKKRDLSLVDTSNACVDLTIWGDDAVKFDGFIKPIILVKGARVTEFGGGKSLSLGNGSVMKINPDISEGHKLRGWFDNGGANNIANSISNRALGASTSVNTDWLSFHEARIKNVGAGDKPDYFQNKATINIIKNINSIYKACPQPECNKKVIDEENGNFRCEKCNASFPNFKYRLLLNMSIGDWMWNRWVTCFNETAEQMLGKTAQEIGSALEQNSEMAETIFSSIYFKEFVFKLRTKIELFGDTQRNRMTVMNASPVDYKEFNKYLIKKLQQTTGVGKM